jgi:Zn-dependent protease
MPASPPDSSDLPQPSVTPSGSVENAAPSGSARSTAPSESAPKESTGRARPSWGIPVAFFLATLASVFFTYLSMEPGPGRLAVKGAAQFTAALLSILLAHEFGHYTAARLHKVDVSLPYFLPLPLISPFGTLGAVMRMRSPITTRRALLDIGASGPLAGLALAIPLYAWGAAHSQVVAFDGTGGGIELGDSVLLRALDHVFAPALPAGTELSLSPVALAAWAGMFVTMINLVPVGQLDGGHVAFALFGPRQNRIAPWVHRSMLAFFFVSLASFVARDVRAGFGLWHLGRDVQNSIFWLVWFEILAVIGSATGGQAERRNDSPSDDAPSLGIQTRVFAIAGLVGLAWLLSEYGSPLGWSTWFAGLGVLLAMEARAGVLRPASTLLDHPPTDPGALKPGRAIVAAVTLALFALLFMPTPMSE